MGLGAWSSFIAATCLYCLVYQAFVAAVTPDPARTFAIALREWGAWALLAPYTLKVFRASPPLRDTLLRAAGLALLAATLPITADFLTGDRDLVASFALFWPRNLAMAAALWLVARLPRPSGNRATPAPSSTPGDPSPIDPASIDVARPVAQRDVALPEAIPATAPDPLPDTLLVSKGADQCLIRVADIQSLSGAGNYIDIRARGQHYLLRTTLADFESRLPAGEFVRIHRSHIVRVGEIERIRVGRSGGGTVRLRDGVELTMSRGYHARLRRHRDAMNHPTH